ncbi:MAG: hypothetical protein KAJ93_02295 [Methanosarcinales archaeon]|nr:hypothetical protein [Methanosarcinales archaeon]
MLTAKVKIVQTDSNAVDDFFDKLDAGLMDVAELILADSQDKVPVDEGMLKKSGHINDEFLNKEVVYDAPYSVFVEFGTSPHMPPLQPIEEWVRRKRGDLGVKDSEIKKVARAIQMKISKYGTDPKPFLRPAYDDSQVRVDDIIRAKF